MYYLHSNRVARKPTQDFVSPVNFDPARAVPLMDAPNTRFPQECTVVGRYFEDSIDQVRIGVTADTATKGSRRGFVPGERDPPFLLDSHIITPTTIFT